ncbi:MAG: peptidoglycan bridge formation glycyltransferase FemA/FemB family protein [Candidatus Levybacteria bacterium]|nr:peptidoglycan bridge formation glycyltransferase FemA/FemB family protein [Candidatus Levybacteria bacterium]
MLKINYSAAELRSIPSEKFVLGHSSSQKAARYSDHKIKEIEKKKDWEGFLEKKDFYPLFQSFNWGEVQKKLGFEIERVGIFDKEKLVGVALIVDVIAKRGHYLHVRHGPVFEDFRKSEFKCFVQYLMKRAGERGASFIRISPLFRKESARKDVFREFKFIKSPIHNMDAQVCWVLDVTKPEEQLLKEMRKTTRYLIKRGASLGLKVVKAKSRSDLNFFLNLYQKTKKKHRFVPHQGIGEEFEIFKKDNQTELFLAKFKNKVISGALVIYCGDQAIYHHGASDEKFEKLSPSYLLQWTAILEAKRRRKRLYNFWGIAPPSSKNHPWQGLTLFKTGFGGEAREFLPSHDLPLSFLYWKTYTIEHISKLLKGY